MPVKTTYYTDEEMARLEEAMEEQNISFSEAVRTAVQDYYGVDQ